MRVYIASMFSDKDRVVLRAQDLADLGIDCTSRWADESVPHNCTMPDCKDEYHRETAGIDLDDILSSDKVVLTVPEPQLLVDAPVATCSRGGRHFESGFVYGLIVSQALDGGKPTRELIVLGKPENVFHLLDGVGAASRYPTIRNFATWDEVKQYLLEEKNVIERNAYTF
jgi:hypothetical protein